MDTQGAVSSPQVQPASKLARSKSDPCIAQPTLSKALFKGKSRAFVGLNWHVHIGMFYKPG